MMLVHYMEEKTIGNNQHSYMQPLDEILSSELKQPWRLCNQENYAYINVKKFKIIQLEKHLKANNLKRIKLTHWHSTL